MAGGAALNIFRMGKSGLPKSVFNRHLWLAVLTFGLMGAARGVDEGLITGTYFCETEDVALLTRARERQVSSTPTSSNHLLVWTP